MGTHVSFGPLPLFLIECKLQGGKGEVAPQGGLVPVEQCAEAFGSSDCPGGIKGGAVVVARVEIRVVVTALELETSFEDFGWDVNGCSGEIGNKTWLS